MEPSPLRRGWKRWLSYICSAALEAVQQAIALDAARIARDAASDAIAECEYAGAVTLAVVVASVGMWTDRLAAEVEYRTTAKRRPDHGQVMLTKQYATRSPSSAIPPRKAILSRRYMAMRLPTNWVGRHWASAIAAALNGRRIAPH